MIEANHFTQITKSYNSDDVNTTMAEFRQKKMRPVSFWMVDILLCETKVACVNKI